MLSELRRLSAERSQEKDAVRRKTLTIAQFRARQKVRRAQATHRCKEAAQMGAPSRLDKALVLERIDELVMMEKVEDIQGRMEIVHKHFCTLFTDTIEAVIPEWIDRRWLRETLEALPVIDGERVREITWAFRKRTSCAEDQVVIEMLREWTRICGTQLHAAS